MLINVEEGLGRIRGNKVLYKRMLAMFLDSKELTEFDGLIAEGKIEDASHSSHSVKGIAGNLSLTDLFDIANQLTEELRKNIVDEVTIAKYHEVIDETKNAVNEVIATL